MNSYPDTHSDQFSFFEKEKILFNFQADMCIEPNLIYIVDRFIDFLMHFYFPFH